MSNHDTTILVLGATGRQGGAVARELAVRGFSLRALTRDPEKPAAKALRALGATVVGGDFDDARSLAVAMEGVDGVYSVQTPYASGGSDRETREGIAVVDAATAAGVKHLVYSSVGGAERNTGIPHFESKYRVESHIREIGINATILRPVFFMENFRGPPGPKEIGGELVLRMALGPETILQMIAVRDIGVFAALAFEGREGITGHAVEIAGDQLSVAEIAATFGTAVGRTVRYERQPFAELQSRSAENAKMFAWFEESGYAADLGMLRRINPHLTTLSRWLATGNWNANV
jgi:uncharacterized protein YbjT (DUF2867 family)